MKKQIFSVFLAFSLFLMLLLPLSSATLSLSKPNSICNLGESLDVQFSIFELNSLNGFAKLSLNCDNVNGSISPLVYVTPISIVPEEEKEIIVPSLTCSSNRLGTCSIRAVLEDDFGNEVSSIETSEFVISDVIDITINLNKEHFLPAETVKITGRALKESGNKIDGMATIMFDKEYTQAVKNSGFDADIKLGNNIKAGNHTIKIYVEDNKGNKGEKTKKIFVNAVPTTLLGEFNKKTFLPGEPVEIIPTLLDQAGDEMNESIVISLFDPPKENIVRKAVVSGEKFKYELGKDAMPGDWNIEISAFELVKTGFVYVSEVEQVDISISGNILRVENTGNVPYSKDIEIDFKQEGATTKKLQYVSLKPGQQEEYILNAPEGKYDIEITAGELEKEFSGISITGKAASIDVEKLSEFKRKSLIYSVIFVLIVCAIIIISVISANAYGRKNIEKKREEAKRNESELWDNYNKRLKKSQQGSILKPKEEKNSFWE